jgi:4-diphosphocytidyl-2-C-methyl-D-erythritol kinase
MRTLHGWAPAKINLGLRVLERRGDGYHELRTILQTISLADRLSVGYDPAAGASPARAGAIAGVEQVRLGVEPVRLDCSDPALAGPENLAFRAARDLLARGDWRGSVHIRLEKKIPPGSGLGGGSSDAAAVLLALARLLDPPPSAALLHEVAAGLGSDVPFFLLGGAAMAVGRGEEVYPLPDPPCERCLLLLIPRFAVATPEAYSLLGRQRVAGLTPEQRRHIISVFCSATSVSARGEARNAMGLLSNDFEAAVFPRFPQLSEWKDRLVKAGALLAMLSGSGSALFGVFAGRREAAAARRLLEGFAGQALVVREMSRKSFGVLWSA